MAPDTFDFVIIGGGTAGLVLAARLSENPDLQVLVIEAGADQKDDPRVNTPALWSTLLKTPSDWAFDTIPQVSGSSQDIHLFQLPKDNSNKPRDLSVAVGLRSLKAGLSGEAVLSTD